ncbi:MAG: FAD-dependent oxidoreductase [Polyangiales bacterium]
MKIAIVGTGISGMVAAWLLQREHEVTVFEASDRIGGHTNTVDVEVGGRCFAVDTGFIVHNQRTYPNLIRIFEELGVSTKPTSMSFSVREEASGLEYSSQSILARRQNALSPRVLRMIGDIVRFNGEAPRIVDGAGERLTLGELLQSRRYSKAFTDLYIVPMGAAIWSTDPEQMMSFPAQTFVRFLMNHGLTSLVDRPTWRVIEGGSREYVKRLVRPFADRVRLDSPVQRITRLERQVELTVRGRNPERFDRVVIATHSDQALRLLADPSDAEVQILRAMRYQANDAILHTDISLLPRRRRAWASWNYQIPADEEDRVVVTYDMNQLQQFDDAPVTFCVSLNAGHRVDPAKILYRTTYHHPVYTAGSVAAQRRIGEISGVRHTYYCGAYWRYGFHEDGVVSALAVARQLGVELSSANGVAAVHSEVAA